MTEAQPKIVLVEDDRLTQEEIVEMLTESLPQYVIQAFSTERAFRESIVEFEDHPPVAFLIDVMLPWDDSREVEVLPPDDAAEQGFYRAGLRCVKLLDDNSHLHGVPIILFSALDSTDVERDAARLLNRKVHDVVMKGGSFDLLIRSLQRALR